MSVSLNVITPQGLEPLQFPTKFRSPSGDVKKIYIDTHANEGFSGGPVVFHPQQGARDPHELRVAGVVTGYIYHNRVLNDADGNHWGSVRENTGIAVAVGAQHATDLIDANQIGFELPAG